MSHSRNLGTESFVDAQSIVQNCWVAGLLQNSTDVVRLSEDKVMQYFVLVFCSSRLSFSHYLFVSLFQ